MDYRQPNIILVNCDDLGYGDLGCYGSTANDTPILDRMAQEGLKFTDFYMAAPSCSPSRGAMLTGCYPRRIGFGSFGDRSVLLPGDNIGLNSNEITMGEKLKQQGYATMHIGKWHCGDQPEFLPTKHGFDHYYGLPYSNDMGRQVGHEHFPPLPLMQEEEVLQEQPDQTSLTERYVEQAVRFIRSNKEQPFFLYFAHMYVHLPLYVPDRFLKESRNGAYGAAVKCIDWAMGVLLDELKRQHLDEETLIIFTSDNGSIGDRGGSNGPLRGIKGTTWEGGMRVPCIMRWPGRIPAGTVSKELVTSLDLFPTFVQLSRGDLPDDRIIDGQDIRSLMFDGDEAHSEREAFFYYFRDDLEAVRSGPWKLHIRKKRKEILELYNLEHDIGEANNVADLNPKMVTRLKDLIEKCKLDIGDKSSGEKGRNCRPVGRVENSDTLTHYDPNHPYIEALYE